MVFRSRCIGSEAGDHKKCRRSSERCLWHVYRCGWDQGATTVCTTSTLFFSDNVRTARVRYFIVRWPHYMRKINYV